MAEVKIMVGGRQYAVHCRDGEEARLHQLAGMMSDRVNMVKNGSPGLTEVRQLLFAGLLLADTVSDQPAVKPAAEAAPAPAPAPTPPEPIDESDTLAALARLAERIEALGDSLAAQLANA
ncbi:cell division protein ZapA [Sphingobium xanthum]|jgi:cell division protein ZapA|uniref:cell division protein ZapA n=1 Tax=Sphingobium xanthum TaxID=1387165 RepID=UPI001C8BB914|nr:cell division protein ZapA [Sphingobium xanthum]